jgi:hypothetical protein
MKTSVKTEDPKQELNQILENYEDEYWSKTYGVSSEELKKSPNNKGISEKIIEHNFKKKSYSF